MITYPIILKTKLSKRYALEALSDLKLNPPKAIITNSKLDLNITDTQGGDIYRNTIISTIKNEYYFAGQVYSAKESNNYEFGFPIKDNNHNMNLSIYIKK